MSQTKIKKRHVLGPERTALFSPPTLEFSIEVDFSMPSAGGVMRLEALGEKAQELAAIDGKSDEQSAALEVALADMADLVAGTIDAVYSVDRIEESEGEEQEPAEAEPLPLRAGAVEGTWDKLDATQRRDVVLAHASIFVLGMMPLLVAGLSSGSRGKLLPRRTRSR